MTKKSKRGAIFGSPVHITSTGETGMKTIEMIGAATPTRIITFKLYAVCVRNNSFYTNRNLRDYIASWMDKGCVATSEIWSVFSLVPLFHAEMVDGNLRGFYISGKKLRPCDEKDGFIGYIQEFAEAEIWQQIGLLVQEWEVEHANRNN